MRSGPIIWQIKIEDEAVKVFQIGALTGRPGRGGLALLKMASVKRAVPYRLEIC